MFPQLRRLLMMAVSLWSEAVQMRTRHCLVNLVVKDRFRRCFKDTLE